MLSYQCIPVGMLESNSYLLKDDATGALALIDCGVFNKSIKEAIISLGGDLRYVLITHGHFDHMQGAVAAKEAYPNTQVAIGAEDAPFLRGEIETIPGRAMSRSKFMSPDVLLHDGDIVQLGKSRLQVIASPGHSPGGVCFLSEADALLFTGDTLFREEVGRADLPGGDWETLVASIRKLYASIPGDCTVLPGHGPATSLDYERKHNAWVRE